MPKGAYLVNCARGGIVDEAALADALASGHLAGAASDVFATEPPEPDNPLLRQPGFLALPHLGASTNGGLERVGTEIVRKVLFNLGAGS
jgi:phosphoglycerate dehydrogenase-like enzyme